MLCILHDAGQALTTLFLVSLRAIESNRENQHWKKKSINRIAKQLLMSTALPNWRFLGNYLSKRQAGRVLAKSLYRVPLLLSISLKIDLFPFRYPAENPRTYRGFIVGVEEATDQLLLNATDRLSLEATDQFLIEATNQLSLEATDQLSLDATDRLALEATDWLALEATDRFYSMIRFSPTLLYSVPLLLPISLKIDLFPFRYPAEEPRSYRGFIVGVELYSEGRLNMSLPRNLLRARQSQRTRGNSFGVPEHTERDFRHHYRTKRHDGLPVLLVL